MELRKFLQETKKLNRKELLYMIKEYLITYLFSLLKDQKDIEKRKVLINSLKDYIKIIKEEQFYLNYLINNKKKISSEEALNKVLSTLDELNENTYLYFDKILMNYEENIYSGLLERNIIPPKNFETIIETSKYLEEIIGLTLTIEDLKVFFNQEESFEYLLKNARIIDIPIEMGLEFYGCYVKENSKKIVTEIHLCIPKIYDLQSMCINIHEFKHGIDIFNYLGKQMPNDNYEQIAKEEEEKFKIYIKDRIRSNK